MSVSIDKNFKITIEMRLDSEISKSLLDDHLVSTEKLYQAFSRYKKRHDMHRCMHCISESENEKLHAKPLRELSPDELAFYAFKAMTTWGDVNDFKHFFPRLLEFYPFIGDYYIDPPIVFDKLTYGNWRSWPEAEQKAVVDYMQTLWRLVLSSIEPTDGWTYTSVILSAIAQAEDKLIPYLDYWQSCEDINALRHLALFIKNNWKGICTERAQSFWKTREEAWLQVVRWLRECDSSQYFENKIEEKPELEEFLIEIAILLQDCRGGSKVTPSFIL